MTTEVLKNEKSDDKPEWMNGLNNFDKLGNGDKIKLLKIEKVKDISNVVEDE